MQECPINLFTYLKIKIEENCLIALELKTVGDQFHHKNTLKFSIHYYFLKAFNLFYRFTKLMRKVSCLCLMERTWCAFWNLRFVVLNGKRLLMLDDTSMPQFIPVRMKAGSKVNLPPYSYAFLVFPNIRSIVCAHRWHFLFFNRITLCCIFYFLH